MATACPSFLAALGIALAGCAETTPLPSGEPAFYQSLARPGAAIDPRAARDMISIYRKGQGLSVLSLDPALMTVAREQAEAMARADKVDHGLKGNLATRVAAAGITGKASAENISAGYHTIAEAFSGWRQSPPHNANMTDPRMTRMGIAAVYAPGTKYKVFWALVLTQ